MSPSSRFARFLVFSWGDYSRMTVDSGDDCTFWYTQEFSIGTGSFNWATHVGAFKFDRCQPSLK